MYVCVCNAVTESQLRESVAAGATTLSQLAVDTGLGICCGRCKEFAAELLQDNLACRRIATPAANMEMAARAETAASA